MPEATETAVKSLEEFVLPDIAPAMEDEILAYLRHSYQMAEISIQVEHQALILKLCEQFNLTIADEELQAAGNEFRLKHKLFSTADTLNWLKQQRISAEDWTQGIRVSLLEQKLKDYLFGGRVDMHYINNRKEYKRVAISQILVRDLTEAFNIVQALREDPAAFCALALDYAQGRQAKERGGFAGIHFLPKLMPEIVQAIVDALAGEIVGPIQTRLGYHIIKIEKWFPIELNSSVREEVLEALFQTWLQEQRSA